MAKRDKLVKAECIFGINTEVRSVHILSFDQILYSCANNVVIWERHDKSQIIVHRGHSRELVQMTVLSPCRKSLAVVITTSDSKCTDKDDGGEELSEPVSGSSSGSGSGSGPYIVIYDITTHRRTKVLRHEKETGNIISVSFSKNGKRCLVLGDEPSYLLTLWNIDRVPRVLNTIRLATPSGKKIRRADMCPTDYKLICVSGNGIVRFFRVTPDSHIFRPVTIQLRREQQNYVHHCWLPSSSAAGIVVLVTDDNELIAIKNFEVKTYLTIPSNEWNQPITALNVLGNGVLIGGKNGSIRMYHVTQEEDDQLSLKMVKETSMNEEAEILAFDEHEPSNLAICLLNSGRICNIALSNFGQSDVISDLITGEDIVPTFHRSAPLLSTELKVSPSIRSRIMEGEKKIHCMDICVWKMILATGGSDRFLRIWDYENKNFELDHQYKDNITSISLHPMSFQILVCTETYVEVNEILQGTLKLKWRKDISMNGSSCCFSNGGQYFALIIGEFVQIYNTFTHEIMCTLRGHSAPIQSIAWKMDDLRLASISKDGTLCIWNTYSGKRIFRHGNDTHSNVDGFLTEDFRIAVMNTDFGVKVLDIETNSYIADYDLPSGSRVISLAMNVMVLSLKGSNDYSSGEVLIRKVLDQSTRDAGTLYSEARLCLHSKAITCSRISTEHAFVFTASEDGSLCVLSLNQMLFPQREFKYNEDVGCIVLKDLLVSSSNLDEKNQYIASLKVKLNNIKDQQKMKLEEMENIQQETMARFQFQFSSDNSSFDAQMTSERMKNFKDRSDLDSDLHQNRDRQISELEILREHLRNEFVTKTIEGKRMKELREDEVTALKLEIKLLQNKHDKQIQYLKEINESRIRDATLQADEFQRDLQAAVLKHNDEVEEIQEQADRELRSQHHAHEEDAFEEKKASIRLKEENSILHKKYDSLMKDCDEHKETILSLQEKQVELEMDIQNEEKEKIRIHLKISVEDEHIFRLEREMRKLGQATHKMERLKIDYTEAIKKTKADLETQQKEIEKLNGEYEDILHKEELESKRSTNLKHEMQKLQLKLKAVKTEDAEKARQIQYLLEDIAALESEKRNIHKLKDNIPKVKKYIIGISGKNVSHKKCIHDTVSSSNVTRERQILERKIKTATNISTRNAQLHTHKMGKLKRETSILKKHLNDIEKDMNCVKRKQMDIFS